MNSMGMFIALLVGYCAVLIFGSKVFRISKGLLTSWANLVFSITLLGYTLYKGMLLDSPLLLVAFGVLIIGSIVRIVTNKKQVEKTA